MANGGLDFLSMAAVFLVVSIIVTLLLKRFASAKTFFIFSMLKTQKHLWVFDKLAVIGKPLDWLTEIGVVLGFGAVAIDFLVGKKFSKTKRGLLFAASTIILAILFYGFDLLLGKSFSEGFLTKELFLPIAVLFGFFGFGGFVIITLIINAFSIVSNFLAGEGSCPGIAPVLPGIEVPNVPISVPLYAWIPLLLVVIIHELMHGVVARKEKIPIKSTGILLFGFLPIGGFVEPDEKELLKAEKIKQLHVFAAGVITNLAAFFGTIIALFFVILLVNATIEPWAKEIRNNSVLGVKISEVREKITFCKKDYDSPAFGVLEKEMIVKEINGKKVLHSSDVFVGISENRRQPIMLLTEIDGVEKEISLTPNELGQFGFVLENIPNSGYNPPPEYGIITLALGLLFGMLNWFLLFNLLLGMINYLPFPVLDGGRIAPIIFSPYLKFLEKEEEKLEKKILKTFFIFILALIIINAVPLFL
ncbi:MAG: site-2 protease family protein [Candidatus Diapherotrites archaeon]|nr:site-2 protease family protein [Candidatus Diapherotrites archaeon]